MGWCSDLGGGCFCFVVDMVGDVLGGCLEMVDVSFGCCM